MIWQKDEILYGKRLNLCNFKQQLVLSIGLLDRLVNSIFPSLFSLLNEHQPAINLRVTTSHFLDLYEEIKKRNIDVAFSLWEKRHSKVIVEECYSEAMVVLRHKDSALEHDYIHPSELDVSNELFFEA